MDSDLLRLILLALGVSLVIGIYLWDRYKRAARRSQAMAPPPRAHVEPTLGGDEAFVPDTGIEVVELTSEHQVDEELPPGEFVGEPVVKHRWDGASEDAEDEEQLSMELAFGAQDESDYLHLDPALMDEVPRLIVQVIVMCRKDPVDARRIREALATVDMRFGEMNIYHRENDRGQVLFSLASVVEPGSFPEDEAAEFSTPGMVLFTQLPGVQDGLSIYSDMLFTAERLAALLDGELHDETRSVLTKQSIAHTREKILEHQRKVQLLRSRH